MSSASSSSPTAPSNPTKRHSLNIYTSSSGPKPLRLVNGPATAAAIPTTTPIADHPSLSLTRPTPRRQSSISYKGSCYNSLNQEHSVSESGLAPRPPQNGGTKPRPRSIAYPATSPPFLSTSRDYRRSLGPGSSTASLLSVEDRPPLTLAEKHADLLCFIAQKESKCLELRSQLAMHEAELLQLKCKWERIVRRSFESPHSSSSSPSPSTSHASPTTHSPHTPASLVPLGLNPTSPSPSGTTTNVVLEGIKESVQGMSRFIAAGLSIANDHPHPNSSNVSVVKPKPRPLSLYASYPSSGTHIRSSNLSTSSASTTATSTPMSSGTRYSATSLSSQASSFFEEEEPSQHDGNKLADAGESGDSSVDSSSCSQELMVRDTGATPTVSPNPKFKFGVGRRKERKRERQEGENGVTWDGNMDDGNDISILDGKAERNGVEAASSSAIDAGATRCHRRRSKESEPCVAPEDDHAAHSSSPGPGPGPILISRPPPSAHPNLRITRPGSELGTAKRTSLVGMLAPVSSIPGLSLAESAAMLINGDSDSSASGLAGRVLTSNRNGTSSQNQSPSSWMGIDSTSKRWSSATLSKGQKRASLLLSDVSQSLVSAFSMSSNSSSPLSGSSSGSLLPTPPATAPSLLDEDDDDRGFFSAAAVLEPIIISARMNSKTDTRIKGMGVETEDDDSEWNW